MKQFIVKSDRTGVLTGAIPQSDSVIIYDLLASTNQEITIPTDATMCIFQFLGTDDLYAAISDTAFTATPASGTDQKELMVNPDVRHFAVNETSIQLWTETAGRVVLNFYRG